MSVPPPADSFVAPMPSGPAVYVRRGKDEVLRSADLLIRFAEACGQAGAMSDLAYFLTKPGMLKRTPLLLLIGRGSRVLGGKLTHQDLLGALLLYEYRFIGLNTGLYTSNDRSGRNTLLALPALRRKVALTAARFLLEHKARAMLLSFREEAFPDSSLPLVAAPSCLWATRRREIPEFLPLASSYDGTLARMGQRTRSNLRYYRRRAEREVGCRFVPALTIESSEMVRFNRECMYAVPDSVARWRFYTLKALQDPLLIGLRDRDGHLLSVLGGRRMGTCCEILWQMNRKDLPHLSLSLVMRSYFLEHEIGRGAERFYIEGGTPHPIRESFTRAAVTDLAVLRRSPAAAIIRRLARYTLKDDNDLASMLFDPALEWQTSQFESGSDKAIHRKSVQMGHRASRESS